MTLKDIRDHVKDDLDLDEETFITDADLTHWINQGIRAAEREIHTLYEDYFLAEADPEAITQGINKVDYPSDCYANKIRKIIFSDVASGSSTTSHEVRRIKDLTVAKDIDLFHEGTTLPTLRWSPSNKSGEGRKIRLYPVTGRTGYLHISYIRNAAVLSADSDVCDIDEFEDFVIQYTKTQAYLKDGDVRADDSKVIEEQLKRDMILSLSDMVIDDDNGIEMDMSFYNDMVGGDC
jgi:hypothetical protein